MVNESNNINLTIENKKPVETVCEIKNEYEIPSFEQFMKTYESDEKLMDGYRNEIDSYGDIGVEKGYGPCSNNNTGSCGNFSLRIECHNWNGIGGIRTANSTSEALLYAYELKNNNWPDSSTISNEVMQQCAALVREAVEKHNLGKRINGYVKAKGNFFGGPSWSYSY